MSQPPLECCARQNGSASSKYPMGASCASCRGPSDVVDDEESAAKLAAKKKRKVRRSSNPISTQSRHCFSMAAHHDATTRLGQETAAIQRATRHRAPIVPKLRVRRAAQGLHTVNTHRALLRARSRPPPAPPPRLLLHAGNELSRHQLHAALPERDCSRWPLAANNTAAADPARALVARGGLIRGEQVIRSLEAWTRVNSLVVLSLALADSSARTFRRCAASSARDRSRWESVDVVDSA